MKRLIALVVVLITILAGCTNASKDNYILPDLTGLQEDVIAEIFDEKKASYDFVYEENDGEHGNVFIKYIGRDAGDEVSVDDTIRIKVYFGIPEGEYFEITDFEYDGPRLLESFKDIDPLDPRGGYFNVTLKYCTDGDTGVFDYPDEIYNAITSNAKSVRFLNMDTEETFSGGEEEWGKPASVYTCDLLTNATEIIIQTDPGDSLLGTYGRLLGWVWVKVPGDDEFQLLNYLVVKQGLAQVKYEFGAGETISYLNHTYNEWMHIAEDYAIDNDLGQWGNDLDYYWDYNNDTPLFGRW